MVSSGNNDNILKLINVSYLYPNRMGVSNVSFTLAKGELVLLVGQTGSGKTTIFKLISLELYPEYGDIQLNKYHSSKLTQKDLIPWRKQIGIVFQDLKLLNDRNILNNVKLIGQCERSLSETPKRRALNVLNKVGMSHKIRETPDSLSIGEQQRVAIARALVNEPFLLIADEPVSNLDQKTSQGIAETLHKISLSGTTVFVATHQPEIFNQYNPRIISMDRGRNVE